MNSRRLSGRQAAMLNLVQINSGKHGQFLSELQPDKNPILQRRAQFAFAFAQSLAERRNALEFGYFARERSVFQLVITRQPQRGFNVGGDRKHHGWRLIAIRMKTSWEKHGNLCSQQVVRIHVHHDKHVLGPCQFVQHAAQCAAQLQHGARAEGEVIAEVSV